MHKQEMQRQYHQLDGGRYRMATEIIHDEKTPPKLGTYTPPQPYRIFRLVVNRHNKET